MAKKCGCGTTRCGCYLADSESVKISGSGTLGNPYVPSASFLLTVLDTPSLGLDLSDDSVLTAYPVGSVSVSTYTVAETGATWLRPPGVKVCRVMIISGGGGGRGGDSVAGTPGGSLVNGGFGGHGGNVTILTLFDTEIPASALITVGAGGDGSAGVSGNANAVPASNGGDSVFGNYRALGGRGGGQNYIFPAGNAMGQMGAFPGITFDRSWDRLAPGGGGNGQASIYSAASGGYSFPGLGKRSLISDDGGGDSGNLTGGAGGHGRNELVTKMGAGGGGGLRGTAGGNGGLYGGGGGGGGYGSSGVPSGPGGKGGPGLIQVIAW